MTTLIEVKMFFEMHPHITEVLWKCSNALTNAKHDITLLIELCNIYLKSFLFSSRKGQIANFFLAITSRQERLLNVVCSFISRIITELKND